jgi:hypothetical protein
MADLEDRRARLRIDRGACTGSRSKDVVENGGQEQHDDGDHEQGRVGLGGCHVEALLGVAEPARAEAHAEHEHCV